MTRSNKLATKQQGMKRKANPLTVRGMKPKMSTRNVYFDGQFGNFRSVKTTIATNASSQAAGFSYVSAETSSAMGSVGGSIANLYSEYVYESLTYRWLPSVAPGTADGGSQVYIGYLDNPEQMVGYAADTTANNITTIKSMRNCKFFNAWESFTYSVPLSRRRPKFDVNITITHAVDTDDRSCQGMVVFCAESVSASTTLGRWIVDTHIKMEGLVTMTT